MLTVQAILGHKWVDTTLGDARLYDETVAADYYAAMGVVEQRLALPEDRLSPPLALTHLVSLVDRLQHGMLDATQVEAVPSLRSGLLRLADEKPRLLRFRRMPSKRPVAERV